MAGRSVDEVIDAYLAGEPSKLKREGQRRHVDPARDTTTGVLGSGIGAPVYKLGVDGVAPGRRRTGVGPASDS